jgi:ABC-type glutathione transport system ATPase component
VVVTPTPVVQVRDLDVIYQGRGRTAPAATFALRGVTLDISERETVGLVGESGAGKTTFGRVLLGLVAPTSGEARLRGQPITGRGAARRLRGRLQVVPQNPDWSLNPHLRVWRSVAEPLALAGVGRRARHSGA